MIANHGKSQPQRPGHMLQHIVYSVISRARFTRVHIFRIVARNIAEIERDSTSAKLIVVMRIRISLDVIQPL